MTCVFHLVLLGLSKNITSLGVPSDLFNFGKNWSDLAAKVNHFKYLVYLHLPYCHEIRTYKV